MNRAIIVILFSLFSIGCSESDSKKEPSSKKEEILSPIGKILVGEHRLRRMAEYMDVNPKISASFFVVMGSISNTTNTIVSVKFAWEMNDGIYAISSLPLEKIRIKIDEKVLTPTIKFRWSLSRVDTPNQIQDLMEKNVIFAVLTLKEDDWPINVKLPLSQ